MARPKKLTLIFMEMSRKFIIIMFSAQSVIG